MEQLRCCPVEATPVALPTCRSECAQVARWASKCMPVPALLRYFGGRRHLISRRSHEHRRSDHNLNPKLFTSWSQSAAAFPQRPAGPATGSRFRFPTMRMVRMAMCSPSLGQHLSVYPFSGGASVARPRHTRFPAPVATAAARCFKEGETVRGVADAMGVHASSVLKALERGRQRSAPPHLRRMAEAPRCQPGHANAPAAGSVVSHGSVRDGPRSGRPLAGVSGTRVMQQLLS